MSTPAAIEFAYRAATKSRDAELRALLATETWCARLAIEGYRALMQRGKPADALNLALIAQHHRTFASDLRKRIAGLIQL